MTNSERDKLIEFIEKAAEKKQVDKQIFVMAVICYHDFIEKNGYKLVYDK